MISLSKTKALDSTPNARVVGFERFTIICGHYGVGKTNLSVNFGRDLIYEQKENGSNKAAVVDMDVVNPYFRSSDVTQKLESFGVSVIAPTHAGSTVESSSISSEIFSVFDQNIPTIFDLGGDDLGATAMGSISNKLKETHDTYEMLYVVNKYRNLTSTPEEACSVLKEVEAASKLCATGVINNSHIMEQTTKKDILESIEYAKQVAELLELPLVMTCVPRALYHDPEMNAYYPVDRYIHAPWEKEEVL